MAGLIVVLQRIRRMGNIPPNAVLCALPLFCLSGLQQGVFIGKVQRAAPIDNLAIGIMGVFGAKWRPTDQAFEHDGSYRPPITSKGVALPTKNFRGDVIGSTHSGICKSSTVRLSPRVNKTSVTYRQVDLIQGDRVPVLGLV